MTYLNPGKSNGYQNTPFDDEYEKNAYKLDDKKYLAGWLLEERDKLVERPNHDPVLVEALEAARITAMFSDDVETIVEAALDAARREFARFKKECVGSENYYVCAGTEGLTMFVVYVTMKNIISNWQMSIQSE